MSRPVSGTNMFGTISLDVDYQPSDAMVKLLKSKFKVGLVITVETGTEGGKLHTHFFGVSMLRQDNIKTSIKTLLEKEGFSLSEYSVDLRGEPRPEWRIGYILKECKPPLYSTYDDEYLSVCKNAYIEKPKIVKPMKEVKNISQRELAYYLQEANCSTAGDISRCLDILIDEGRLDFPTYNKINRKNLLDYILRNHYL